MFEKSVTLRQVEKRLDKLAEDASRIIWWRVAFNLVMFLPTLGVAFFEKVHDESGIETTAVSDEWLGEVAKLARVSRAGSNMISETLESKGWLSIAEAKRFLEIEKAEEKAELERSTKGLEALKAKLGIEGAV